MYLSMDELVAFPVAGKLTELLEGQLGNDFCAHTDIILPSLGCLPNALQANSISSLVTDAGLNVQEKREPETVADSVLGTTDWG